jgi:hypothetical protein
MTKRIQIQIFPDGRVQAETQGIKGKKCTEYISVLEELLEAEAVESGYKPEYYVSEEATVEATEQQRLQEGY